MHFQGLAAAGEAKSRSARPDPVRLQAAGCYQIEQLPGMDPLVRGAAGLPHRSSGRWWQGTAQTASGACLGR